MNSMSERDALYTNLYSGENLIFPLREMLFDHQRRRSNENRAD